MVSRGGEKGNRKGPLREIRPRGHICEKVGWQFSFFDRYITSLQILINVLQCFLELLVFQLLPPHLTSAYPEHFTSINHPKDSTKIVRYSIRRNFSLPVESSQNCRMADTQLPGNRPVA